MRHALPHLPSDQVTNQSTSASMSDGPSEQSSSWVDETDSSGSWTSHSFDSDSADGIRDHSPTGIRERYDLGPSSSSETTTSDIFATIKLPPPEKALKTLGRSLHNAIVPHLLLPPEFPCPNIDAVVLRPGYQRTVSTTYVW